MLDEVDSTNSEAQRRAAAGERGPIWICARAQTKGRGRSGRAWGSPAGTLAASLLFMPGCTADRLPELSLVAGLAAAEAVGTALAGSTVGRDVRIKWPNDVLVDGAKISGILIESAHYGRELVCVVGIGINIAAKPDVPDRAVTSLADLGVSATPDEVAPLLAAAMGRHLTIWQAGAGFAEIRGLWLARGPAIGTPLSVHAGSGIVSGTFAGLDTDGALLLQDGTGRRQRFTFGDVTHGAPPRA